MIGAKLKAYVRLFAWGTLILIGWCLIMTVYLSAYSFAENNVVPVGLPLKDFYTNDWDEGFFQAKGALKNDAAVEPGDEVPPEAAYVTCSKATNTCTVTTADVFDHFLNLDSTDYDIETWNAHQITFKTDFAVCTTSSYAIDREAETFTMTVRKKTIIPEYALKSPLHPCGGKIDEDISLAGGFPVYWHLLKAYEQRNGIYFHLALVALNISYFAGILWLVRLRRRRTPANMPA